jgi:hypothetical protein
VAQIEPAYHTLAPLLGIGASGVFLLSHRLLVWRVKQCARRAMNTVVTYASSPARPTLWDFFNKHLRGEMENCGLGPRFPSRARPPVR